MEDIVYKMEDNGYKMKDNEYKMEDSGSKTENNGSKMEDKRSKMEKISHANDYSVGSSYHQNLEISDYTLSSHFNPTDYSSLTSDYDQSDQSFSSDDSVTFCRSSVFVNHDPLGQYRI